MKEFAVTSMMNSIGFVVKIQDDSRLEEAKLLASEGLHRWFDLDNYPEYHDVGCAEPSMFLLDEAGIEYEIDSYYYGDDCCLGDPVVKKEYEGLEEVYAYI